MAAAIADNAVDQVMNGDYDSGAQHQRWYNAPIAIDVPVQEIGEEVELNLQDLDDPTELCQLLENEKAERKYWITVALAYARKSQLDHALEVLQQALRILSRGGASKDRLSLLTCKAWLYLSKSRMAPRMVPEAQEDTKTKEYYLREATQDINEAMRINPSYPPLHLLRGSLNLLRASLTTSTKTGPLAENERNDALVQAVRCFEDAIKQSAGRNILATMGKARALYLQRKYQPALQAYQQVLARQPQFHDPDPRIGIGACMWQLGFHDHAKVAWERVLSLNQQSTIALTLLGIYYLRETSTLDSSMPEHKELYKKAITDHLKVSYGLDKMQPLNNAVFANYFLYARQYNQSEALAKRAIERTDVNTIASDAWFTRAQKEAECKNVVQATDAYTRADAARGGQNAGYFPAKFGMVQLLVQAGDVQNAKFQLEKLLERNKSFEVMSLLGCICAEEIFSAWATNVKEDKNADTKKAVRLLEAVRRNWSDEKAKIKTEPDSTVLLYLARLYEHENPFESEKCLQEVENIQRREVANENNFDAASEDFEQLLQEQMPPQLHNNIGCFCYNEEAYEQALQRFQIALNATLKLHQKQAEDKQRAEENGEAFEDAIDTDALVMTISYNLARTYEALEQLDNAVKTYEGVLSRHPDYTDASARLAYIALRTSPQDQGPKQMKAMYNSDQSHAEVRSLMGWYYHSSKARTANTGEDQEYRHYKHTLLNFDKHDVYSLIGMGNIHLHIARDMPRNNDAEKDKRSKQYQKAYEFFDKALQLDPQNAYAAQGVAIALCDDKKAYSEALQILVKIKDTIRDVSVFQNLGHVYCELKQYQRSIDNYETALKKQVEARDARHKVLTNGDANGHPRNGVVDHKEDAQLLASLSRVWLIKAKSDRSVLSMNSSLDFMRRALSTQPDSPHLRFNLAFIQFNIAQLIISLLDPERTLEDVQSAKVGLEEAVSTFEDVANGKNPPYPKHALDQRAAMSKGSMMKQIDRALAHQADYERQNSEKLAEAKRKRMTEIEARQAATARRQAEEDAREAEVAKKRADMITEAEKQAEKFRAEALAREAAEYTTDEETGERKKREKKVRTKRGLPVDGDSKERKSRKRKQRAGSEDGFIERDDEGGADSDASHRGGRMKSRTPLSESEEEHPKKKKKLARKGGRLVKGEREGKYKSAAVVVDSDESGDDAVATPKSATKDSINGRSETLISRADDGDVEMQQADELDDDPAEEVVKAIPRQRKQLRTIADEDEEDEDAAEQLAARAAPRSGSVDEDE